MKTEGYVERLHEFTALRRDMEYVWGSNDCVTFAADAILVMTGEDPLSDLRDAWWDEESAQSMLEALGGLIEAVNSRGFVSRDIDFIKRGDLCLIRDLNGQPSLGIWTGEYAASPGPEGLMMVSGRLVRMAWEV